MLLTAACSVADIMSYFLKVRLLQFGIIYNYVFRIRYQSWSVENFKFWGGNWLIIVFSLRSVYRYSDLKHGVVK